MCTGIKNGNCGAILTSKAAKVFSWLSWSEVGFFYFAGALMNLIFAGSNIVPVTNLVGIFNIAAIVYPLYSLYYQWRVAKEWCILCLVIQAILIAGAINTFSFELFSVNTIIIPVLAQSFALYLLPVSAWYIVKPFVLKLQEVKQEKREYLRLKYNTEVFEAILQKQKSITISTEGLGIDLGNMNARHELIKVCNPYCGPCAKAHPRNRKTTARKS
ncbi:MAG: vitamin K epoxide reductase family protein [Niabella sp.]